MLEEVIEFLNQQKIQYEENVDLKKKTWIHRGGICRLYVTPSDKNQLKEITSFLYKQSREFILVGHTSNLYILNRCNPNIVISTLLCSHYNILDDNIIECESGASVQKLAIDMVNRGKCGLEYLTKLPGTIGGALFNNSSCKSNSISALLVEAEFIRNDGEFMILNPTDFNFSFRNSSLKDSSLKGIIISAKLKVNDGNISDLKQIAQENEQSRQLHLEGNAKNLGCTVNRCFINGRMPLRYRIPLAIYSSYLSLVEKDVYKIKIKYRNFLCRISGFKGVSPYISYKNPIVFMWIDEYADEQFSQYLRFMEKVYKTDKLEINVIK